MNAEVRVLGGMNILGSLVLGQDNLDFPTNPKPGTLAIKGLDLYAYLTIGGFQTWYPLINAMKNNSHVHTQGIASVEWTIIHNLDVTDFWYQLQDQTGSFIFPSSVIKINTNTYKLTFAYPTLGTVITVGTSNVVTDKVNAAVVNVGGTIVMDSTGITVDGQYVAIGSDITAENARAVAAETALGTAIAAIQATLISGIPTNVSQLTNDSNFLSEAQVDVKIQSIIGLAPANLNTLVEIASALNNDANAAANITSLVTTNNAEMDVRVTALEAGGGSSGGGGMSSIFGNFSGGVGPIVGTQRYYPSKQISISKLNAWVSVTSGVALTIDILLNGIVVDTITIPAGQMKTEVVPALPHIVGIADYLTLNIVSGTGTDLTVRLDY